MSENNKENLQVIEMHIMEKPSRGIALVLAASAGFFGLHRFYSNEVWSGISYILGFIIYIFFAAINPSSPAGVTIIYLIINMIRVGIDMSIISTSNNYRG